jgi:hypothetical protein
LYDGLQHKVLCRIVGCRGWTVWSRSMDADGPEDRDLFRYIECEQVEFELQDDMLYAAGCRRLCSRYCLHGMLWSHTEKQMFINRGMISFAISQHWQIDKYTEL